MEVLEKRVKTAELSVIAELGETEISIQDFLSLGKGDVIELNAHLEKPLTIKVGEVAKFIGQPGKVSKKMAVQILDTFKGGEEENVK